jgi:acetolactate synthase-1/2/3 large subunit
LKGYAAIPAVLQSAGVSVVFAMLGGSNVPWLGEGVRAGAVRLVKTRHEETAVAAAAGYSRASGQVGVCSVTRGPGFANSINALLAAVATHVPIVLIVGESPSPNPDTNQNIHQQELAEMIGAGFAHAATAAELPSVISAAISRARWDGTPQVVSTGDGAMEGEAGEPTFDGSAAGSLAQINGPIAAAASMLGQANAPLVLAGHGAVLAGCREDLWRLADLLGAMTATSLLANCFFAGYSGDLGLSGGWAAPLAYRYLNTADVVLAVGASMNPFTCDHGRLYSGTRIIQCDITQSAIGAYTPVELGLVGDARSITNALCAELSGRVAGSVNRARPPGADQLRDSVRLVDLGHRADRGMDLRDVYTIMDRKLPAERIVVTDSGRCLATGPLLIGARDARSWLVGRGYGTIGHGLGTAIGAAIAWPDRPVVLFAGDGGFMMSSHDLDAVRLAAIRNLTIVVMNDQLYGSELRYLEKYDLPADIIFQPTPDLAALARVYGGDGATVWDRDELATLDLPLDGLFIVDARLDPEVDGRMALGGTTA